MNNSKYHEYYELLGIVPGDSWSRIRHAHKALMKHWHPDRYTSDTEGRNRAEEMTKQINQAYQEIFKYFDQHGHLPLKKEPLPAVTRHEQVSADSKVSSANEARHADSGPLARNKPNEVSLGRFATFALITSLILLFIYLDPAIDTEKNEATEQPNNSAGSDATNNSAKAKSVTDTTQRSSNGVFGVGSTLGEVYSTQGVPSRVDGDTWHYNNAEVIFSNGRVIRWIDTNPPSLRTSSMSDSGSASQPSDTSLLTFTIGSTKEDVRAAQGSPVIESAKVWDYGQSQVHFDGNGRVEGWKESPYNPLHIKH